MSLMDSAGKPVPISIDLFQIKSNPKNPSDSLTLISVRTSLLLQPGMLYTATLAPGIMDRYGNISKVKYSTSFDVDTLTSDGNMLENFEGQATGWIDPIENPGTVGVDSSSTSFSSTTSQSYVGYSSAKLTYSFDSTNGVCELFNAPGFPLDSATSVGMWVFADNSGNILQYCFGNSCNSRVTADTLNWYGWRFVRIPVSEIPGETRLLKGMAIVQSDSAILDAGTLYFDAIQTFPLITLVADQGVSVPSTYLLQNYPNPFNPTTKIDYFLKESGKVTIEIYDVLGRAVETLVNNVESSGRHSVEFNAADLSSGVYIYSLTNPEGVRITKKMILLK